MNNRNQEIADRIAAWLKRDDDEGVTEHLLSILEDAESALREPPVRVDLTIEGGALQRAESLRPSAIDLRLLDLDDDELAEDAAPTRFPVTASSMAEEGN